MFHWLRPFLVASLALIWSHCTPGSASAQLIINASFNPSLPPSNMIGGGNLADIVGAAAAFWQNAYRAPGDAWVLNLQYEWAALPGRNGQFHLTDQGGSPHRIISGLIQFDNSAVRFFADPTPFDNSEYTQFHETTWDTPFGMLNSGRQYSGATGDAAIGTDLLTIAIHEMGHALGLSAENTASPDDIVVSPPRPFAGLTIPTFGRDHLELLPNAVMGQTIFGAGERTQLSGVDILANAQISLFDNPDLNPIPEPGSLALAAIGLAGIAMNTRSARARMTKS